MRNILCITQLFPPIPNSRAIQSYRLLSRIYEYDFWPTIYCEKPSGHFQGLDYTVLDSNAANYEIQQLSSLYKVRICQKMYKLFPILQIPDEFAAGRWSFLSWNLTVCLYCMLSNRRLFDLIFSISAPPADHITGLLLKMRTKLPWVAFFSDPWIGNPAAKEVPCHSLNRWLQKKVVEKTDALIFTTEETRDFILGQYPTVYFDKSFVIPHSFYQNFDAVPPRRSLAGDKKVIFRYVGIFYPARTPEALMAGISIAKSKIKNIESHFQFEFIGNPYAGTQALRMKYKIGKELIEIDHVPYLESLGYMKGADVLINLDITSKVNLFLPSKLVEYIGARRTIFGITPRRGASADLIRKAKGFIADPSCPEEIANYIIKIVREKQSNELNYHQPDESLINKYRTEGMLEKYVKAFNKAIAWANKVRHADRRFTLNPSK